MNAGLMWIAEPSFRQALSGALASAASVPSLAAVALLAVGLCAGVCSAAPVGQNGAKPQFGNWGVDLTAMDKSVKPGDDFYAFVNGARRKSAIIPPDRPYVGIFANIQVTTEDRLTEIVAALAAKPYDSLSDDEKKLRDFYDAFLDQKAIDAAGLAPTKKDFAIIAGLDTHEDVAAAMGRPDLGFTGPLGMSIDIDVKNPNRYAVMVGQAGLPMHTPDSYRVIGVTRNQDAWYAAFDVKPGDKYYLPPDQRVHMW